MNDKLLVRYLLGAGASANSIPPVNGFSQLLSNFIAFVDANYGHNLNGLPVSVQDQFKAMSQYSTKLYDITKSTFSIDTYAKMLWIRNDPEYTQLKFTTAFHLILAHLTESVDSRYDAFLTALLKKRDSGSLIFPENLQIVTWNYDYQLLLSFLRIKGVESKAAIKDAVEEFEDCLPLVKLNGSCFPGYDILAETYKPYTKLHFKDAVNMLALHFDSLKNNFQDPDSGYDIRFGWDSEVEKHPAFDKIKSFTPDATVIIGYSLPRLNYELDKKVLTTSDKLYIQCSFLDAKTNEYRDGNTEVTTKLKSLKTKQMAIETLKDSKEFYLPPEIDQPRPINFANISR